MPPLPGVLAMLSPSQNVTKTFNSVMTSSSNSGISTGTSYIATMTTARTDVLSNRIGDDSKYEPMTSTTPPTMTSAMPSIISTATTVPSKTITANSNESQMPPPPTQSGECGSTSDSSISSSTSNNSSSCSSSSSNNSSSSTSSDKSKSLQTENTKSGLTINNNNNNNNDDTNNNDSNNDNKTKLCKDNVKEKTISSENSTTNNSCDTKDNESALVELSTETDSDLNSSSNMFGRPREIFLRNVNAHITCSLCNGYLIDATTIVECLHSFCHSCIMNYLRKDQYCPRCEMMINTTKHNNIKLDTTLQAIVYKLVPGLYEKELLRKRAFYSTRPEEAKLATPEQRGDDTEHLIFGPTDNMSLSLEFADMDELPADDIYDLRKPKYLQCPANFTVSHLKKFVFGKFGIDTSRFIIDIMYKVKTIVLADHYKLMDVAYIYTWKRDAPMKFFFRVKETECRPRRKLRRRPMPKPIQENILEIKDEVKDDVKEESQVVGGKGEEEIKVEIKEEDSTEEAVGGECKALVENKILPLPQDCMVAVPVLVETNQSTNLELGSVPAENIEIKSEDELNDNKADNVIPEIKNSPSSNHSTPTRRETPERTPPDHRTEKLKITLINTGKSSSKDDETPKSKSNSKSKTSKHSPPEHDDRKVENIKLKIDLSKQGSVTIINMSSPDSSKKDSSKPLKQEKEWKIKVKKEKNKPVSGSHEKGRSPSHEKTVPPITIELGKSSSPNPSKSHSPRNENEEEEFRKSEFLNYIDLAPIKSINASPEKMDKSKLEGVSKSTLSALPIPSFTVKKPSMPPPPPPSPLKLSAASKRKSKEPVKAIIKKPKLDSPSSKPFMQPKIKVRTNLLEPKIDTPAISFKLSPFPIGSSSVEGGKELEIKASSVSPPPAVPKDTDAERKSEDEKLMPAPPPLKMLDVFKRNGLKPTKGVSKAKGAVSKIAKTTNTGGFMRPIVTTSMTQNSKVPIVSNVMGNRTPIARRYPPILPKSQRSNPFAALTGEVTGFLQGTSTEIKPIQNGESKEIKVYGPPVVTLANINQKPVVSIATAMSPMQQQLNQRSTPKPGTNYLNCALLNSAKSKMGELPLGCRTPIYTPSSPVYSPNSPQYMPNYNIPIQPTFKYTKTQSSASNYLHSILGTNKQLSNLFPAPPVKKNEGTTAPNKSEGAIGNILKRNNTPPLGKASPEPHEKQTPVQSLLNSCNINIPSSLSITIRNETDDANSSKSSNMKHSSPVNNYIEILKLPDATIVTSEPSKNSTTSLSDSRAPSNPKSPNSLKLSGVSINTARISPPVMTTPPQLKPPAISPTSVGKAKESPVRDAEKKMSPLTATSKNAKKTPSPEKKSGEKGGRKAEKRSASDPIKSPKDKHDISPPAVKKYRPILPRSQTPPPMGTSQPVLPMNTFMTKMVSKIGTGKKSTTPKSKKTSPKTANNNANTKSAQVTGAAANSKKSDSVVDLLGVQKPNSPTSTSSPVQAGGISPELTAFLTQQRQLLQQQQQQQAQPPIPFGPLAAAAPPAFLPHLGGFHPATNLNIQRAYLMEQLARMQKAGADAIEKYIQMKNTNGNCVKSPSVSPGNNGAASPPASVTNNVKNSA